MIETPEKFETEKPYLKCQNVDKILKVGIYLQIFKTLRVSSLIDPSNIINFTYIFFF